MKKLGLLSIFLVVANLAFTAEVDTVNVFSKAMNKEIKTVIITPQDYDENKRFPVIYLLHGYGGKYSDWVNKAPEIKKLADEYSLIVVSPDGGKGSWYWDSPIDDSFQYETFVSKELVQWVDENYKSIAKKQGRAITGLSMGGHGALYLAFKNSSVYGAVGSTAGGVDIRPFPKKWDIEKRLGSYAENPKHWDENTVINMLHLVEPGSLEILIDCGKSDFFYPVNQKLHEKMELNNIAHTYISKPGAHNWDYWKESIPYQFLFMHRYFEQQSSDR